MKQMVRKLNGGLGIVLMLALFLGIAAAAYAANGSFTTNKHWKQKFETFSATAAEAITIGDPVALNRYNGKAYRADADDADRRPAVGLAGKTTAAAGTVEIVSRGILSGMPCGLGTDASNAVTPIGTPLLLSPTLGGITIYQTALTGVSQFLGYAGPLSEQAVTNGVTTSTDTYIINVVPPRNSTAGVWY